MEKITNYLELIQQIQDITPEKEAFCTTGRSLTYSQLYALAKEKQGMLKQEKKKFPEQNAKKQLRIIQTTRSEERRGGKECRSRWSPYH